MGKILEKSRALGIDNFSSKYWITKRILSYCYHSTPSFTLKVEKTRLRFQTFFEYSLRVELGFVHMGTYYHLLYFFGIINSGNFRVSQSYEIKNFKAPARSINFLMEHVEKCFDTAYPHDREATTPSGVRIPGALIFLLCSVILYVNLPIDS